MNQSNFDEKELLNIADSTSMDFQLIVDSLVFPQDLRKKTTLDIGGGGSDITAELHARGAYSYAIDPRYANLEELIATIVLINKTGNYGDYAVNRTNALQRFIEHQKKHPENYIAAFATSLPFRNNHFDYVFSIELITVYLDMEYPLLKKATLEALRVTKPGGKVQLFPYLESGSKLGSLNDELRLSNQIRLTNELRMMKEVKKVMPHQTKYGQKVLIIEKVRK